MFYSPHSLLATFQFTGLQLSLLACYFNLVGVRGLQWTRFIWWVRDNILLWLDLFQTLYVLDVDMDRCTQPTHPVKVLDCDSISQAKEKILDAIYKNAPFSSRPPKVGLDLGEFMMPCGNSVGGETLERKMKILCFLVVSEAKMCNQISKNIAAELDFFFSDSQMIQSVIRIDYQIK